MTDLSIAELARSFVKRRAGVLAETREPNSCTQAVMSVSDEPRHVFFNHLLPTEMTVVISVGLLSDDLAEIFAAELQEDGCSFAHRVFHIQGMVNLQHEPTFSGNAESDLDLFQNWFAIRQAEVDYLDSIIARILARAVGSGAESSRASFVYCRGHA